MGRKKTIRCRNTPPTALTECLKAVTNWLRQSRLKLNPQKIEVLWVGKKQSDVEIRLPHLDGTPLTTSTTIKSLGVIFDASLSIEAQITKVAHQAFYHLRQVKQLAPYLFQDDLATLIHATVTSRFHYCNSLYAGLPLTLTSTDSECSSPSSNKYPLEVTYTTYPKTIALAPSGVQDQIQNPNPDL